MIFRKITAGHDWTFGSGKENFTARQTAIGLNIKTRILSWVGDCFFDQLAGIDWINRLGGKNQRALLEADLRRIILQSEGVTAIKDFDTILNDRSFVANYSVNTIYSQEFRDSIILEN